MKKYRPPEYKHILVQKGTKKRFDKKVKLFQSGFQERKATVTEYLNYLMDLDDDTV